MVNRIETSNNRHEARESHENATGSASGPPMGPELSSTSYNQSHSKELVDSNRRREIVEHSLTHLPWGVASEIRIRALNLARQAVIECGPAANELVLLKAATEAVERVVIELRRRERKETWVRSAARLLPFGATENDETHARKAAGRVLDDLPIDTPGSEVERCIRENLMDLATEIRVRQRKKELVTIGVAHIERVLNELYLEDLISLDERYDSRLRRNLEAAVRRELKERLVGDETDDDVRVIVESTVEDALEVGSTTDDEDDGEPEED